MTTTISGTWKLAGSMLTVTDVSSMPTTIACPAGQEGTYAVAYSGDCSKLTLAATSEPCDGRKLVLDGINPARQ